MDLSHPANDLFGASTARVLQRLSSVRDGLTGRRLSQLSEVSLGSTQRALAELEDIGLVDARPAGRAVIYSINRGHVLWAVVEAAFNASRQVENLIVEIVQRHQELDVTVALYGSFVRGEAGRGSDLDVLVVWHSTLEDTVQAALLEELDERVSRATGNRVEILDLTIHDLQRMAQAGDPLVASLRREAKTVSKGADLRTLLKAAAA